MTISRQSFTHILLVVVCSFFLVNCGGNKTEASDKQLTTGVAASVTSSNFGQASSPEEVKAMSEKLGGYFNGKYANNPTSLMGEQALAKAKSAQIQKVAGSNVVRPVFRFYNTKTQTHFFTMSTEERDHVVATFPTIYSFEGTGFSAFSAADPILSPIYRFYNKVSGTHFYTISSEERDHVITTWPNIFSFEGVSWYASAAESTGWVPIYRFFNTRTGVHFYTASVAERDYVLASLKWFTLEGIAYYVRKDAQVTEIINGIVVPLAPDSLLNSATVAGIDGNGNGVRDDVERVAAEKLKNTKNFEKIVAYAKAEEAIITSPTPLNRADALRLVSESYCAMGLVGEIERGVITDEVIANTDARREKLNKFNYVVGGYFGEEVSCK